MRNLRRLLDLLLPSNVRPSILPPAVEPRAPRARELRPAIPMEYLATGPSRCVWNRTREVQA